MKTKFTTQTKSPAMLDTVILESRSGLKLQLGAPYLKTSRSHGAGPATLSEDVWTWPASAESIDLIMRLVAGEAGRWKLEGSLRNRGTASEGRDTPGNDIDDHGKGAAHLLPTELSVGTNRSLREWWLMIRW